MKYINFNLLPLGLVLFTTMTFAQTRDHTDRQFRCPTHMRQSDEVKSVQYVGTCVANAPLKLSRTNYCYPLLDDCLDVDYWRGSYSRSTLSVVTRTVVTYDCYGSEIYRASYDRNVASDEIFAVKNPNLSTKVATSFEANAPMTDAEANTALQAASLECSASH